MIRLLCNRLGAGRQVTRNMFWLQATVVVGGQFNDLGAEVIMFRSMLARLIRLIAAAPAVGVPETGIHVSDVGASHETRWFRNIRHSSADDVQMTRQRHTMLLL